MRYKTKREAAEAWVREFDAIPQGMIEELMEHNPDGWREVTLFDEDEEPYGYLPAWGTMWSFHDSADEQWFEYGDMDWYEGKPALVALSGSVPRKSVSGSPVMICP